MNWANMRPFPWLDTRARFVAQAPTGGTVLDLSSSDGETLGHFAELRLDLRLFAADKSGRMPVSSRRFRVRLAAVAGQID